MKLPHELTGVDFIDWTAANWFWHFFGCASINAKLEEHLRLELAGYPVPEEVDGDDLEHYSLDTLCDANPPDEQYEAWLGLLAYYKDLPNEDVEKPEPVI